MAEIFSEMVTWARIVFSVLITWLSFVFPQRVFLPSLDFRRLASLCLTRDPLSFMEENTDDQI